MYLNIAEIMMKIGVEFKHEGSDGLYFICPFCDDKKGHLNVIPKRNVWRCARCGSSGGLINFIEKFYDVDRDGAVQRLRDLNKSGNTGPTKRELMELCKKDLKKTEPLADEKLLDGTYRALLSMCKLKDIHYKDLARRGLTDEQIKSSLFRSVPSRKEAEEIIIQLVRMGCQLRGVPGFFYKENKEKGAGRWMMTIFPSGYFVPFINVRGYITAMQIRTDPGTVKWKYSTFTSVKQDGGCKAIVEPHYIRGEDTTVVYLTEGALKAEVAKSLLSSKYKNNRPSFMAIPGVNGTKALENALDYLKNQGVVKIKDCFDMDKSGNNDTVKKTAVRDAVEKIKQMCLDKGFQWQTVEWPTQKGIDDYILKKSLKTTAKV